MSIDRIDERQRSALARDQDSAGQMAWPQVSAEFSAHHPLVPWQRWTLVLLLIGLSAGLAGYPRLTLSVLFAALALPFLCIVVLRGCALFHLYGRAIGRCGSEVALSDDVLPQYSILVPLFEEAEIVPDLVAALRGLDYPRDKLDIQLIVESADPKTYAAVFDADLPDYVRVNVVPTSPPQTKPQALNHALKSAWGDVVVVYDAEDVPEPDQLRRAAVVLNRDPNVGCVQACLNVYNSGENFLTRGIA